MTIMLIYSTISASGTKWKQWAWSRENCSFGNHLCNGSLHSVHGTLFGVVEMDCEEITLILFSDTSLYQTMFPEPFLNLVVFNIKKKDSVVPTMYHCSNTTWNDVLGWLLPTASHYTLVMGLCSRLCIPPRAGSGVSSNASLALCMSLWWVRIIQWMFLCVYTSVGTGVLQRIA